MENPDTKTDQKPGKTFPVKLLRGYWPRDKGKKIKRGEATELPENEAKDLIKRGLAVRNDPL